METKSTLKSCKREESILEENSNSKPAVKPKKRSKKTVQRDQDHDKDYENYVARELSKVWEAIGVIRESIFKKDIVNNQGNNRTEAITGRTDNRFEILSKESEENTLQNLSIAINRDNNSTRSVTQTNDNQAAQLQLKLLESEKKINELERQLAEKEKALNELIKENEELHKRSMKLRPLSYHWKIQGISSSRAHQLNVSNNMLLGYCKKIAEKYNISIGLVRKLIPTLKDKKEYVLHY